MIERSFAGLNVLPIDVSAGTSGETPPLPCSPWHCAHANWTKLCPPEATCGSTEAGRGVCVVGRGDRHRGRPGSVAAGRERDEADDDERDQRHAAEHRYQGVVPPHASRLGRPPRRGHR